MKIVCLGDSITWGYPWGPEYSWVNISAQTTGLTLINKGVNGDTTEDLLRRYNRDVAALKPSHLIIMVGTNDASINMPLKQYASNIHTLIERALSEEIIPALGLPIKSLDSYLEKLMADYRRWAIDYCESNHLPSLNFDNVNLLDDVHPTKDGYRIMAESAVPFLMNWK